MSRKNNLFELLYAKEYAQLSRILLRHVRAIPCYASCGSHEHLASWLQENHDIIHYAHNVTWSTLAADYAADLKHTP